MPISLVDILPTARRVEHVAVGDQQIECFALSLGDIAGLLSDFPALAGLLDARSEEPLDAPNMLKVLAPRAIAMIIAAGTGHAGEEPEIVAAMSLPADLQLDLMTKIVGLTSPAGLIPFVEKAVALLGVDLEAATARLTKSPSALPNGADTAAASGKVPDTISPS